MDLQVVSTLSPLTLNDLDSLSNHSIHWEDEDEEQFQFETYLWMYVSPVIFVLGVCGNALVLAVMRRKKLRGSTTSVYLPLLAIADTAALVTGVIPEWLYACGFVHFKEVHPATCKLEKFLFYTSGDIAVWLLVAFTFDRFVAVVFPLKKRLVCVPKRAVIGSLVILLAAVAKNLHVIWTRGAEYDESGNLKKNCGKPHPFKQFETYIRPWIAFGLISVLPFCVIFISNCFIIRRLLQARRMRSTSSSERTFTQTTLMCLSASFTFLLCITPSIVLLIGKPYWTTPEGSNQSYNTAKAINNQLVFINHSINFVLYCLTGQRFRKELVLMFSWKSTKDTSSINSSSTPVNSKIPGGRKYSLETNITRVPGRGDENSKAKSSGNSLHVAEKQEVRETSA